MSVLVKPTLAPIPRTPESAKISLLYAGVLVLMVVSQLFTFEDFIVYVNSLGLPLSPEATYLVAPLLVVCEVFALPFLLRMWLSPAFRAVSMFLGWAAAGLWISLTVWIVAAGAPVSTIGFLGTLVDLMPGYWAICVSLAFGILAAWSSWGLWPGKRTDK